VWVGSAWQACAVCSIFQGPVCIELASSRDDCSQIPSHSRCVYFCPATRTRVRDDKFASARKGSLFNQITDSQKTLVSLARKHSMSLCKKIVMRRSPFYAPPSLRLSAFLFSLPSFCLGECYLSLLPSSDATSKHGGE
jgi:hypothetical protein